jgi:hypothetical protein
MPSDLLSLPPLSQLLVWFHGGRLGGARLPPASSGLRVPNFERRRAGAGEKSTAPLEAGGVVCVYVDLSPR